RIFANRSYPRRTRREERQQAMSATLDRIIEEVRALPSGEQRQLVEQLNAIVSSSPTEDEMEDAFERELMAEGVLGEVKPLSDDDPEFYAYRPVTVTGKPVSETIIEERG
ncbi:MAG: hypothetical protein M3R15_23865, partial [Acidobacteriota bacterium]|nr:hypothetical protein [Acidobacteriota bacterium]